MKAVINSIEYHLPGEAVGNDMLKKENPDWDFDAIESRAGVVERYFSAKDETALDIGYAAATKLFAKHPELKEKIDTLIFCTQSPDYIMPSNSCILHGKLQFEDEVFAFDFNHACSGYIYALTMANSFIKSGQSKNILLVTADTYSKYINKHDRATRVLFGDGGSATWISGNNEKNEVNKTGIESTFCATHGKEHDKFIIPAGGMRLPKSAETAIESTDKNSNKKSLENIHMQGLSILTFTNSRVPKKIKKFLKQQEITLEDIDKVILHQASKVAMDSINRILKIPSDKTYSNLKNRGNTVSSTIPIALKDAQDEGAVKKGDLVLLIGFGVGLSYGCVLVRI